MVGAFAPNRQTPNADRPARFNVLLTEDRPGDEVHWTAQLVRLLEPQGVVAYVVRTGDEAVKLAQQTPLHAAIVDLATPRRSASSVTQQELWLVELMRRLPASPPLVVLRSPATSGRQADRLLRDLLQMGAFSVLVKPVQLEKLLGVFQRLVERRYQGRWPTPPTN